MRGNVPPRRLRRTGLQWLTPTGPAAWSLEAGKRGRGKVESDRPGAARAPVPVHLALHVPPPQGPAPVPTAGPGLRRVASGDTVPRQHAHGPGTTSPAARAGGVRSRLPIGTWVKIPAEGRPTTGPPEGPRTGPRAPGRAIPRGPGGRWAPSGAGRGGQKKQSAIGTEGPTPGRPGRGPGGRAGRRTGASRPLNVPPRRPRSVPRGRRGTGERRSTRPGSLGDGRRSLPQKPAPPISGERATRRRHGTTGTIPPVTPAARNASPGTAARSLPLARSPELRRERTI